MADETGSGGVAGLLDFTSLSDALEQTAEEQRRMKEAQQRATQVGIREAKKIETYSLEMTQRAAKAQTELDQLDARRAESHRLRDSNNPLDRIELIGAQILEPHKYTKQGRTSTAAEIQQGLSLAGHIHATRIAQSQATSALAQARAADAEVQGTATLDLIRNQVLTVSAMNEGLIQTESLRKNNLHTMTIAELNDSLSLTPNEAGRVEIGDFAYQPFEIAERARDLKLRRLTANLPIDTNNSEAMRLQQQSLIQTFSSDELLDIINNPNENGQLVYENLVLDRRMVSEEYEVRKAEEDARLSRHLSGAQAEQLLEGTYERSLELIDDMESRFPPGSPMGRAAGQFRAEVAAIGSIGTKDSLGNSRPQQLALLNAATEKLFDAAQIEAETQAGTDKALVPLLRNKIVGQPNSPAMILDYAVERFQAGKDFSRAFESKTAQDLGRLAEQTYQQRLAEQESATYSTPSITEKKEIRAVAMREAFEKLEEDIVYTSMSLVDDYALQADTSPLLNAGLTQGKYAELQAAASSAAALTTMEAHGISEKEFNAAFNGQPESSGLSAQQQREISNTFNQNLVFQMFEQLETEKPGLGESHSVWLRDNYGELMRRAIKSERGADADLFQAGAQEAARLLGQQWALAAETAKPRRQAMAQEQILKLRDPEVMLPALLDGVTQVPDDMKGRVWREIIEPALAAASQQQLGNEERAAFVTQALDSFEGDAGLKDAAHRVLRALPQIQMTYESLVRSATSVQQGGASTPDYFRTRIQDQDSNTGTIDWLNDPQTNRGTPGGWNPGKPRPTAPRPSYMPDPASNAGRTR